MPVPDQGTAREPAAQVETSDPDAGDLVKRAFTQTEPNRLWVNDITEHPTREGKAYCAAVLDVFSRRMVGWSIDSTQTAALVTNALCMAISNRTPTPETGTIIHSDYAEVFIKPRNQGWGWSVVCCCQIRRHNDSGSSQAVEGLQCVFGEGLSGGGADCWSGGVDGGAHHVDGGE